MTTEALPLIQTKLYRPPIQADIVPRPRLVERLNSHWQDRPLTLISAPAGYGKSVLASMWLQECESPNAWISLDETDNDLGIFTAYLLAAVSQALPDLQLETAALLELPTLPQVSILVRYLLNDLNQSTRPFILVLDDIHHIHDQAIFELLNELLRHPPPPMHLVLVGRHDPPITIASLRAYRHMNEIRGIDLRFTVSETAELLEQTLHRSIAPEVAAEWAEKTEGWATALHLAALSLQNRRSTAGSRAPALATSYYLQEYFLAEVLARVPPDKQTWLLTTSVLDRFCAPLCEAVCQQEGESLTGQTFVSWLQASNLFLISLDDKNEWFRLHHLFQSHLRSLLARQLSPQGIAAIHLRASQWLADNGNTHEAIQHALKAGDVAVALDYVYKLRYQLMNNENWIQLERLIKLFPDDQVTSDPILSVTMARIAIYRGQIQDWPRYLNAAEQSVASLPTNSPIRKAVSAEMSPLTGLRAVIYGQPATDIIADAERALETLPEEDRNARSLAIGVLIAGFQMAGNWQQGLVIGKRAVMNPDSPSTSRGSILLYMCLIGFMEGALDEVLFSAAQGLELNKRHKLLQENGRRYYYLAIVHYLRNDLISAENCLLKTISNPLTTPDYLAYGTFTLARLYQVQHRLDEAAQILRTTSTHLENVGDMILLETLRAFQVEFTLYGNNLAEARQLSQTIDFERRPFTWYHYIPQLTPVKLLLHQGGQKNLQKAEKQLAAMENYLRPINRKMMLIEVLALQALVHDALGDGQAAHEKLRAALHLAQPGGFIRNFIDLGPPLDGLLARLHELGDTELDAYISQILAAFPMEEPSATSPTRQNPLTKRELQTLRLLATDLTPQEIAVELAISVNTTRTHIRNIYRKLDVQSRYTAVATARQLELI